MTLNIFIHHPLKATTMRCVPSSNSVVIGTIDGKVMLVDIIDAEKPRLVFEKILHKGPLTALGYVVIVLPIAFSFHLSFYKKLLVTRSALRSPKKRNSRTRKM